MSDEEKGLAILGAVTFAVTFSAIIALWLFKAKAYESCLAQGFPKYTMTWNFRVFCLGYDGVVHPVVKERTE